MEANQLFRSDFLDILFENRNKKYGAYMLRKEYNGRVLKSLLFSIALATGLFFMLNQINQTEVAPTKKRLTTVLYSIPNVSAEKKEAVQPKKQQTSSKKDNNQTNVSRKPVIQSNDFVFSNNPDTVSTQTLITNTIDTKGPGGGHGKDSIAKKIGSTGDNNHTQVFTEAEIMPSFPGGMKGLRQFLEKNLENPDQLEEGQEIEVKVGFIVGLDGKLKSFQVLEDGGKLFNEEVIRVLKIMPDWIPGQSKGENVSVYFTIPVKFMAINQ